MNADLPRQAAAAGAEKGPAGVLLLGATGSVGQSACAVLRRHPERFRVVGVSAARQADELEGIASEFGAEFAILACRDADGHARGGWEGEWRYGAAALAEAARDPRVDIVVNALVGFAGLEATLAALGAGKRLALANKESLVAGGELVMRAWREGGGEIIPVDSEHSAIHQCLAGRPAAEVHRLILTASGGPFRETPLADFPGLRAADALAHPTWDMGAKITIDSATMANKALEVIEAHLLFDKDFSDIDVVVHPSSIVHSFVEFRDGSTMAQLGYPTMEVPVLYALGAPERLCNDFKPLDPVAIGRLEFEELRRDAFPMFELGIEAGRRGGTTPAAYSAANEVAVEAFLDGAVDFPGIHAVVSSVIESWDAPPPSNPGDVMVADAEARRRAVERLAPARARND
jgi:1-deoxy-D-xylulose-5-phosphate reductoisomerase